MRESVSKQRQASQCLSSPWSCWRPAFLSTAIGQSRCVACRALRLALRAVLPSLPCLTSLHLTPRRGSSEAILEAQRCGSLQVRCPGEFLQIGFEAEHAQAARHLLVALTHSCCVRHAFPHPAPRSSRWPHASTACPRCRPADSPSSPGSGVAHGSTRAAPAVPAVLLAAHAGPCGLLQ